MSKTNSFYETVDQIVTYGIDKGILHLYTSDQPFDGTSIVLNGKKVVNFGSCSYLGLEFDSRIKAGGIDAISKYGTQFSESRAYASLGLYKELQNLLEKIFGGYCVITPTTTLGHIANIPVLIDDKDAIIMDQQVHNSVQTAVQIVKARGVHTELVRHNRMDLLEERIKELRSKHKKIWYMADGIYSMFGDCTPIDEIYSLMNQYPEFYFYVDDAHGMSIHGKHGRGFVLSNHDIHPKMALATSLNKAFATGGGVLVYGDMELARKVGTVGGPLLSSGPMQPSALGAAIVSARIHLSDEIILLQELLKQNIEFTIKMLKKYNLPVISKAGAAIFFVGVSLPKLGHNLVKRMMDAGYYVNLGVFPTVPMKQTGIRFTITLLHTFDEIENMVATLAENFPLAMKDENVTLPEIYKAFKLPVPEKSAFKQTADNIIDKILSVQLDHYSSIGEVDKNEWNQLFKGKGTFDWDGLALLEKSFKGNLLPEDNWKFDYLLIKDTDGNIIAATFLTTALWKDDMLSRNLVSKQVEYLRKSNPYYLTSKVICSGSLITEGEHLYINQDSPFWKEALQLLFDKVYSLQELHKANTIVLRDFQGINQELDNLMIENGFFKFSMPDSLAITNLSFENIEEYFNTLTYKSRQHLRRNVLRNESKFKIEIISHTDSEAEVDYWYQLYLNVKNKGLELNTFPLPRKLFTEMNSNEGWEVVKLSLRENENNGHDNPVCVIFCYKAADAYMPVIIGIDYELNEQFGIYRQALYQLVIRANQLGKQNILFGFSATIEKKKVGAKPIETFGYMHAKDTFNMEALSTIPALSKSAT